MATTAQKATSAARKAAATAEKAAASVHKGMTAPPSTAYKIVDVPELYRDVIQRHAVPGTFVGPSEKESPWVPFGANAAIRHFAFDVRHNIFSNILWIKSKGVVGTHKHRGTVVMVCLETDRYCASANSFKGTPEVFNPCTPYPTFTNLRYSVGFGFRWFSPIGPLRFEWGIPLNKQLYL